ncbi:amino acid ABC transporter permease [Azorhizobium oxalatiphilum]|uniref:Amino acid ABC transporter permease n=1 Tax=Azorhizobium oxalatiphilum TaxID=980631 RepID=A0A917FD57_9HYPH|nr:branched-chain amino acid ABC transporter permease [Azorhizobium oxalatiphilum]GGF69773.1 amino acid ABC transporter permease [Azorhizobium oxalatiphilum]
MRKHLSPGLVLLLLFFVAAAALPFFVDPRGHLLRVAAMALLFAAMAQSWNIVGGLANQVSLGHAAFFGLGAYTSTLLFLRFGISPWIGMFAGAALAAFAAALLSFPTFRLKGHYFALATLAFAEVLRVIANSWASVTGGPVGLSIPFLGTKPELFAFRAVSSYYWIILALLVIVCLAFRLLARGAIGYRLRAVRENENAAEVAGVDTFRVKLTASIISAAFTALCGTVFAQFTFFFDPDSIFALSGISVRMAMIAIVGGLGTLGGPIIGALFLIPLEEVANAYLSSAAAGLSQFVFGAILVAAILIQPRGLMAYWPKSKAGRLARKDAKPVTPATPATEGGR